MTGTDQTDEGTATEEPQRDVVPGSAPQAAGPAPDLSADFAGVATPPVGTEEESGTAVGRPDGSDGEAEPPD